MKNSTNGVPHDQELRAFLTKLSTNSSPIRKYMLLIIENRYNGAVNVKWIVLEFSVLFKMKIKKFSIEKSLFTYKFLEPKARGQNTL